MKNIWPIFSLVWSSTLFASPLQLTCKASYNSENALEKTFVINNGESNKMFGGIEEFEFFVSKKNDEVIELQAYNTNEPSRTYATGSVAQPHAFVELSIWKRDFLMKVRCGKTI